MNDENKKDNIIFTWILKHSSCLLTIIFIVAVAGFFYSIIYELWGYNIDWLPDVGTPADFCGVLGTMLAIFVTWQQMKKSDDKARKNKKEAREKFKASQEQFNKTIKEMQKEREEAYKPDLYMDTEEKHFFISKGSTDIEIPSDDKEFKIINVGAGTAKNIVIKAYSKQNRIYLQKYLQKYVNIKFNMFVPDNWIAFNLPDLSSIYDSIRPIMDGYLFSKMPAGIPLPEIYLQILRYYIFKLIDEGKIKGDPYTNLPKFTYNITYQDQEEIKYSKKIIIWAKCWDMNFDKYKVTLSIENKPAHKI